MNKLFRLSYICLCLIFLGCSSSSVFKSYPSQVDPYLVSVSSGRHIDYNKEFAKELESNDRVLYAMEKGRLEQIQNLSSNSLDSYKSAISDVKEIDNKAIISVSDAGTQASAVALNDNAIPYNPPGYERIMLHQFQSMNYLAMGNLQGAAVEVRAANNADKKARARHEKDIIKAKKGLEQAKNDADMSNVNSFYAGMNSHVGDVKSSFLNAYTYYYSGVIYEMINTPNDAYIDYKRALEIAPDNVYIARDVLRLAKKLGMREDYNELKKVYTNFEIDQPGGSEGTLVVLFEDGFVKQKDSIKIPIPYFGADTIIPVTCPIYKGPWHNPSTLTLKTDRQTLKSQSICSITDLAAKSLQEDLPIIIARVVIRAVAKAVAAKQMQDSLGEWGSFVSIIYNSVTENADRRSWLSIPDNTQIIRTYMPAGKSELEFRIDMDIRKVQIEIHPGKITLVRVVKTNGLMYITILYY